MRSSVTGRNDRKLTMTFAATEWLAFLLGILEVQGLNLGTYTRYCNRVYSLFKDDLSVSNEEGISE
jgi:hypothetical protein